jgi:hypothetical protein
MATPWHFKETPEEFTAKLCIPEGDPELTICDVEGNPMFKLSFDQNLDSDELRDVTGCDMSVMTWYPKLYSPDKWVGDFEDPKQYRD